MLRVLQVVLCLMLASVSARAQGLASDWMGTLDAGPLKLRLVFHITENEKGLAATLDSLDQNAKGLPVSSVTLNGAAVKLEMPQIGAAYEGQRAADGARIDGTFTQQGQRMPLALTRVTNAAQMERPRPQTPAKSYPYREEDVTIDNASAGVRLAGTLTLPQGQGPFTAVVLISGSGPQDRNESLMGHAPFLVLADYLTRRGIAVLRYDDRGFGKSTGSFGTATTANFATDAEAALTYLGTRAEIASRKIGLIGHSEGGVIAPMVAARNTQVAFMVLMAGTGVRGDEVLVAQAAAIVESMGGPKATVDQVTVRQRETLALVKTETDDARVAQETAGGQPRRRRSDRRPGTPDALALVPLLPRLRSSRCAAQGHRTRARDQWRERSASDLVAEPPCHSHRAAAGNKNVEIVEFASLNHLFQTAKTGAPGEYGDIEETMAPAVLDTIATWVSQR